MYRILFKESIKQLNQAIKKLNSATVLQRSNYVQKSCGNIPGLRSRSRAFCLEPDLKLKIRSRSSV